MKLTSIRLFPNQFLELLYANKHNEFEEPKYNMITRSEGFLISNQLRELSSNLSEER